MTCLHESDPLLLLLITFFNQNHECCESALELEGKISLFNFTFLPFCFQANETGGSQQTELAGAKRCFSHLQRLGVSIAVFVSDWHREIAKWIRENCPNTKHFFDIWHVARSVTKVECKQGKRYEIIKDWMKGIKRHIYWCATSTKAGFESLILAKWNSFMRHVANKHSNHPDPLYKQCHHGDLEPRKWIKIDNLIVWFRIQLHVDPCIKRQKTHLHCIQ